MQTPTTKKETLVKPAITADSKTKPAPATSARDAQIPSSVFDSCIPGGMHTYPVHPTPKR